ncbi:hypothetical protein D3C81_1713260 [compost metagenome]
MEGGIKGNDLRNIRHVLLCCVDPHNSRRIMKRSQIEQSPDFSLYFTRNECRPFKCLPTVHDAVPDSLNFIDRFQHTVLFVCQLLKHLTNRGSVLKDFAYLGNFLFIRRFVR